MRRHYYELTHCTHSFSRVKEEGFCTTANLKHDSGNRYRRRLETCHNNVRQYLVLLGIKPLRVLPGTNFEEYMVCESRPRFGKYIYKTIPMNRTVHAHYISTIHTLLNPKLVFHQSSFHRVYPPTLFESKPHNTTKMKLTTTTLAFLSALLTTTIATPLTPLQSRYSHIQLIQRACKPPSFLHPQTTH